MVASLRLEVEILSTFRRTEFILAINKSLDFFERKVNRTSVFNVDVE